MSVDSHRLKIPSGNGYLYEYIDYYVMKKYPELDKGRNNISETPLSHRGSGLGLGGNKGKFL
jgi:hypothetical protein